MKIFKKLSALCLVLLATFTLSIATPAVSFAKAAAKAPVTMRTATKKATVKAKRTAAKRTTAKARRTAAKRTKARMTTAKRTAAKRTAAKRTTAKRTAAKRTTAKRMTAAKRTAAKARLTAVKTGAKAKVTVKALNVRSGPAKTYKKIGTLRKGATVKVVASKGSWKKIHYGTRTGYVYSKGLK